MAVEKSWYLVYTKPRQERVARTNLERQRYETYLPLMREVRRRQGRRVTVTAPMFPRYLFIHLDRETDNWGPIRSTLGVVSVVRFGQEPARAPDELLNFLHSREDESGLQMVPVEDFQPGGRVRIVEGPLSGYEGIYLAKGGHDRVAVLLNILGQESRTTVDVAILEPVSRK